MKRIPLVAAAVAASAALALSAAAPASAAPGQLRWTFNGAEWHDHVNPAPGCYTIAAGDAAPAAVFQNETVDTVALHIGPDCTGPVFFLESDNEAGFPTRSYRVFH
ncbi:hypothetical protein O4J56_18705 [Nocardiopsis sp. RSe5-2]|uniref:Secreted protein n=1 Tax=Nocardiopsis endophytica TaxID=3018445 RepID=A0ABT4U8L8_9ACTN|nr:hypothetical protein [Nocardiopsis endophytica]MDA2812682.1 hypothetical protein [Nocardiopsis endophytica]